MKTVIGELPPHKLSVLNLKTSDFILTEMLVGMECSMPMESEECKQSLGMAIAHTDLARTNIMKTVELRLLEDKKAT